MAHTTSKRALSSIVPVSVGILVVLVSACTTVNELGRFNFRGSTLAAEMQDPPSPRVDVNYNVRIDKGDPIGTYFSLATNVAKASYAAKAKELMDGALRNVDVPGIVLNAARDGAARVLGSRPVESGRNADYIFHLEIRDYGIGAPGGTVEIQMNTTARLYETAHGELIWRRDIRVSERLSPAVFGFHDLVDNVVTLATLAELTEEEIISGFENVAVEIAQKISRRLEDDLRRR